MLTKKRNCIQACGFLLRCSGNYPRTDHFITSCAAKSKLKDYQPLGGESGLPIQKHATSTWQIADNAVDQEFVLVPLSNAGAYRSKNGRQ